VVADSRRNEPKDKAPKCVLCKLHLQASPALPGGVFPHETAPHRTAVDGRECMTFERKLYVMTSPHRFQVTSEQGLKTFTFKIPLHLPERKVIPESADGLKDGLAGSHGGDRSVKTWERNHPFFSKVLSRVREKVRRSRRR